MKILEKISNNPFIISTYLLILIVIFLLGTTIYHEKICKEKTEHIYTYSTNLTYGPVPENCSLEYFSINGYCEDEESVLSGNGN